LPPYPFKENRGDVHSFVTNCEYEGNNRYSLYHVDGLNRRNFVYTSHGTLDLN